METASFGATSFVDVVSQQHRLWCWVLWVVDSLLSRLGFLLDDDKTPRRYGTVGR